jgi:uncharacterized membrane protein YgdD (TMEM256/DUF423 family)
MALEPPGWVATTNLGVPFLIMRSASLVTSRRRLRRVALPLLGALLAIVTVAAPAAADVSFINAKRSGAGLAPVSSSGGLASLAQRHSQEMANAGRLFHTGNLGASVSTVVSGWQAVGENVGVGDSVDAVNAMFMQSSAHRANILGNYNLAGVGVVQGGDGRYWVTQTFARVAGTVSSAPKVTTSRTTTATAAPRTSAPRVSRSAPRTQLGDVPAPPPAPPAAVAGMTSSAGGFRLVSEDGGVFTYGSAVFAGSAADLRLTEEVVDGSSTPRGDGYVLFGDAGGVFAFGDAKFFGSAAGESLHAPVVAGAMTPSGLGYYLFSADGGAITFGDAVFAGSLVDAPHNGSIVAGARTPSGGGYWLVGSDGGVYAFGDALFHGSAAQLGSLAAPIVSITPTSTGGGYWLVSSDGGVFAFGDAKYFGSAADKPQPAPVKGLVAAPGGHGYWLVRSDREVLPFGTVDEAPRWFFGVAALQLG